LHNVLLCGWLKAWLLSTDGNVRRLGQSIQLIVQSDVIYYLNHGTARQVADCTERHPTPHGVPASSPQKNPADPPLHVAATRVATLRAISISQLIPVALRFRSFPLFLRHSWRIIAARQPFQTESEQHECCHEGLQVNMI